MSTQLHGQKLSPFEQGYSAFLRGAGVKENPFDGDKEPFSRSRWTDGWDKAQRESRRK